MDARQALDIRNALSTLSTALDLEFKEVATRVCFFDEEIGKILKEASDTWCAFEDAEIVERGKMLGLEITVSES